MPKWLKIVIGLTITGIIFFAVLGVIFYKMLTSPLPVYEGELKSAFVKNRVEIYRDSVGIPYILAANEQEAAFALGYVHAQERLFTMDLFRRAAEGRLSEIIGPKMIPFDKMFLTIGIKKYADDNIGRTDPEVMNLLHAYAAGVNLYINENRGKYPVEFDILGYEPEKWKPENSLELIRLLGWELNIAWWIDYTYAYLSAQIGEEKARQIFPAYDNKSEAGVHSHQIREIPGLSFLNTDRAAREFLGFSGTQLGSNNWVVDDSLSESGKILIANDTHLPYGAPGTWYAAVIKGGKWNAEGITLPGVPGIVIGKNRDISWVLTNAMTDDADFYVEKIDSSGSNYFFNGQWKPLVSRKVRIKVKNSPDVLYVIKYTHRGPIVSGIHTNELFYKHKGIEKPVVSMRWTGYEFSDEMLAFYKINLARNWSEFRDALRTFALPGQNFVYGDKEGNTGYLMGTKIPVRSGYNPLLVYDGTTDAGDWKGFVPFEMQPSELNPPRGFIATANNKVVNDFPYYITNLWEPDSRVRRITELLLSKQKHSVHDFQNYQMDQISPYARDLTKYIVDAFEGYQIKDEYVSMSVNLLRKWDFSFGKNSQPPAIYAVFLDHLLKNIYMDDLGHDFYNEFTFISNIPYRSLMKILADSLSSVIDDMKTKEIETRKDIIIKSMIDAVNDLRDKYGDDIKYWQWGMIHTIEFRHAFGGISPLFDKLINIGPFRIGGDGTTIFNTEYRFNEGIKDFPAFNHKRFENVLGPTMRYIFDFSRPDEFYLILNSGQSGQVLSTNYRNMSEMWLEGRYLKIRTDEGSMRNPANKLLTITGE